MHKALYISLGVILGAMALTASAAAPAVTCSGTPTGSQVLWSANVTGGVAPLTYAWGNGATSSTQTVTYSAPGVVTMNLSVTDASSTVGTASCSVAIAAQTTPTTTPPVANNCVATTSVPVVINSSLAIGPKGNIELQGMKVVTAGTGSFTGSIWGITYTVNSTQSVTVGNYVRLTGRVSTTSPLTINAREVKEQPATRIKRDNDCRFDSEHGWGWLNKKDLQNNLRNLPKHNRGQGHGQENEHGNNH